MSAGASGGGGVGGRARGAAASPNFGFLAGSDPALAEAAARAERYGFEEPSLALVQLRIFGERLARQVCAEVGLSVEPATQVEVIARLRDGGWLPDAIAELFHALRKAGNRAAHGEAFHQREALHALREARHLAVWFYKTFRDPRAVVGLFVVPPNPAHAESALVAELERAREALAEQEAELRGVRANAEAEAALRAQAQEAARRAYEDLEAAMALAEEAQARGGEARAEHETAVKAAFERRLEEARAAMGAATQEALDALLARAREMAAAVDLDEAQTRQRIDAQLRAAGWEVDSAVDTYARGARPEAGRSRAIAEWPMPGGRADYVLFVGLTLVGVVEAKREARDVSGSLEQAKRYSRDLDLRGAGRWAAGAPWGAYKAPFLFSTNGRAYLRQLEGQSGVWFWDARCPSRPPRPLGGWYTPEGLAEMLRRDEAEADARLAAAPWHGLETLHPHQKAAIEAAERALLQGQRAMLLAMATGTGKTRMALGLIYRMLKAGRFRRVLFLVDRTELGKQALDAFRGTTLTGSQTLATEYEVAGLDVIRPGDIVRLHVATVQGMVARLFGGREEPDEGATAKRRRPEREEPEPALLPVDLYDCVIVDECHRGYALDKAMSDTDLEHRRPYADEYLSTYRRVLDHFDAVKIGLTATPARHTTQIFGPPIFSYSYRQAVVDGILVDHLPPFLLKTQLGQGGIRWEAGEQVRVYDTASGQVSLAQLDDELNFEVDRFNEEVLTDNFNKVVCQYLAQELHPASREKTLIFCANDRHADTVVRLLKQALLDRYGDAHHDDDVLKITSAADNPSEATRRYKTDHRPHTAVTVDLLTTGVDVPAIFNLVFLRRIKSRILYEQMLGRATRRNPDPYKEAFRVFDAVGLCESMAAFTDMRPVVARPQLGFGLLIQELLSVEDPQHQRQVCDELRAKLQAKRARLTDEAHALFLAATGHTSPDELLKVLADPAAAVAFLRALPALGAFLDAKLPTSRKLLVSEHDDALVEVSRHFAPYPDARACLDAFAAALPALRPTLPSLDLALTDPAALTRDDLSALRLGLEQAGGFSELLLRGAWEELYRQEHQSNLVGLARHLALGQALRPHAARVDAALGQLLARQRWTDPQRKWLTTLANQCKAEILVDRPALDRGVFKTGIGGAKQLDELLEGRLYDLLRDLHALIWA
jgi:type I restriction enzyme R subunit